VADFILFHSYVTFLKHKSQIKKGTRGRATKDACGAMLQGPMRLRAHLGASFN
jgi:hypothetical protein